MVRGWMSSSYETPYTSYLCWQPQALKWPRFLEVLGLKFLWRILFMIFSVVKGRILVYVFEPFHSPHVNRGDWHSGSNPDASDCSSDVKVMKTGGSPYQQPTSYLGGDRQWSLHWICCLSKHARHNIEIKDVPLYQIYSFFNIVQNAFGPTPGLGATLHCS